MKPQGAAQEKKYEKELFESHDHVLSTSNARTVFHRTWIVTAGCTVTVSEAPNGSVSRRVILRAEQSMQQVPLYTKSAILPAGPAPTNGMS